MAKRNDKIGANHWPGEVSPCRAYRHVAITLWAHPGKTHDWGYSIRLGRGKRLRPHGWESKKAALAAAKQRIDRWWSENGIQQG